MKIACISLGCPKNQVDLDVMVHILLSAGHETVADLAEADVILVNTCGFIESAKTEAIENILEACSYKQQNPELKVIVTGCLAERYRSQIEEEIPEVDAVVGCASNKAIDTIVARLFHGEDHLESYGAKKDFPLGGKRVIGTPAHYAYLKIAEGCNNRCHYCAIPGIRGPLHSRDMADCVAEARWLAGEGVKELIVVAQDPTAYGEDWGKPGSICELLDKLNKVPGLEWIRIMYAYPERITDDFIAAMKRNEKVVPYLDLPIQHGPFAVLFCIDGQHLEAVAHRLAQHADDAARADVQGKDQVVFLLLFLSFHGGLSLPLTRASAAPSAPHNRPRACRETGQAQGLVHQYFENGLAAAVSSLPVPSSWYSCLTIGSGVADSGCCPSPWEAGWASWKLAKIWRISAA